MKIVLTHDTPAGTYAVTDIHGDANLKWSGQGLPAIDGTLTLDYEAPSVPPSKPPVDNPPSEPPDNAPSQPPHEDPPVAVEPPANSVVGKPVHATAKIGDKTYALDLQPGERKPFVPGDPSKGGVKYYEDGWNTCIENRYAGTTADLTGTFTLSAGNTKLYSGTLTIPAYRTSRPFWLAKPQVRPDADLSYFPIYGSAGSNASMYDAYMDGDNSPTGYGATIPDMSRTGAHNNMGPLPKWDAIYYVNPTEKNAIVVRGMNDGGPCLVPGCIDMKTQRPILLEDYPNISFNEEYRGENGNPILPFTTSLSTGGMDNSHCTAYYALSAELYGTAFDKEQLRMWNDYVNCFLANPGYRTEESAFLLQGQVRGKGRGLMLALYADRYASNAEYVEGWIKGAAKRGAGMWLGQLGLHCDQSYQPPPYPHNGHAPWMNDILIAALGFAIKCGYTEYQPLLDYFSEYVFQRFLGPRHELATIYEVARLRAQSKTEAAAVSAACIKVSAEEAAIPLDGISIAGRWEKLIAWANANLTSAIAKWVLAGGDGSRSVIEWAMRAKYGEYGQMHDSSFAQALTHYATAKAVPVDNWEDALATQALYSPGLAKALTCASGSQALIDAIYPNTPGYQAGDFSGYPTSPTGYPAMAQPAVAVVVRYASERDRAAKLQVIFDRWSRIDYSSNPKFNLSP